MSKLKGVADTLFIPLTARIYVSKKFPEYFFDAKAVELEKARPDETILKRSSEYSMIASAARYYNMDKMVLEFAEKHGPCNVVYLGCGLETACYRLKNVKAKFFEVDLPEVIKKRRNILGECENEILIGGDLFALDWVGQIDTTLPTITLASGVFMYFHKEKVVKFISELQERFDQLELVFDIPNEDGIKYTNRYVRKTGNKDAMMYFFVNDGNQFAGELNDVKLIEERPFFIDARKILKNKTGLYSRIAMRICDKQRRAFILHLKLC